MQKNPDSSWVTFDGIVDGRIQYSITGRKTGVITTVKSINLTPFKTMAFTYTASAGYNAKDYGEIYAQILDTDKKIIKTWRDNKQMMDYQNTGFSNVIYRWDISSINQQAFITMWISLSQSRGITFQISKIEFTV